MAPVYLLSRASAEKRMRGQKSVTGSLFDLLSIDPILWTIEEWGDEQLQRLKCHILPVFDHEELGTSASNDNNNNDNSIETTAPKSTAVPATIVKAQQTPKIPIVSPEITSLLEFFERERWVKGKDHTARRLFQTMVQEHPLTFKTIKASLRLFVGKQPVLQTPSPLLFLSKTHRRPLLAFVDKSWMFEQRYKACDRKPDFIWNLAQQMTRADIDPYFVGLLISMAQNSRDFITDDIIDVHLFSLTRYRESFVKFSANIPCEYLRNFDQPQKLFTSHITVTRQEFPCEQPHMILQALREIQDRCANTAKGPADPGKHVSSKKYKVAHKASPPPSRYNLRSKRVRND